MAKFILSRVVSVLVFFCVVGGIYWLLRQDKDIKQVIKERFPSETKIEKRIFDDKELPFVDQLDEPEEYIRIKTNDEGNRGENGETVAEDDDDGDDEEDDDDDAK